MGLGEGNEMESLKSIHEGETKNDEPVGMIANAVSETWDVALDQTVSGIQKWFAQIEGPSVYLYFQIESPCVIRQAVTFIGTRKLRRKIKDVPTRDCELMLGKFAGVPVSIIRDDESSSRCFLSIGHSGNSFAQFKVSGIELKRFTDALAQLADEVEKLV